MFHYVTAVVVVLIQVHRIFTLAIKYCNGRVPDASHDVHFPPPFSVQALVEETENNLKSCSIHVILFKAMEAVRATNKCVHANLVYFNAFGPNCFILFIERLCAQ